MPKNLKYEMLSSDEQKKYKKLFKSAASLPKLIEALDNIEKNRMSFSLIGSAFKVGKYIFKSRKLLSSVDSITELDDYRDSLIKKYKCDGFDSNSFEKAIPYK